MNNNLIITPLHIIIKLLEKILTRLEDKCAGKVEGYRKFDITQDLIDGVSVMEILKIEKSTLYRIKKSKALSAIRIGKKDYYSKIQIEKIVDHFKK